MKVEIVTDFIGLNAMLGGVLNDQSNRRMMNDQEAVARLDDLARVLQLIRSQNVKITIEAINTEDKKS